MAECPFIDREIEPAQEPIDLRLDDETSYRFYTRDDGRKCQYCKLIGRTYDIWTCLNDWQWTQCSIFRAHLDQLPEDFSLDDVPAFIR